MKVLRPGDLRRLPERHALIVAGAAPPIIGRLTRCLDGTPGRQLSRELERARAAVTAARADELDIGDRTAAALEYARSHHLTPTTTINDADADADADDPDTDDGADRRSRESTGWSW